MYYLSNYTNITMNTFESTPPRSETKLPVDPIQTIGKLLEKVLVNTTDPDAGISFDINELVNYKIDLRDPELREEIFNVYYELTGEQLDDSDKTADRAGQIVNQLIIEYLKNVEQHQNAMIDTKKLLGR